VGITIGSREVPGRRPVTRDDDDDDNIIIIVIIIIIKNYKKIATLGTGNILRKVLVQKYKTYFTGNVTLHVP